LPLCLVPRLPIADDEADCTNSGHGGAQPGRKPPA
jgi:hypothetical protein